MSPQDIDDFKLLRIESSQISDGMRRGKSLTFLNLSVSLSHVKVFKVQPAASCESVV